MNNTNSQDKSKRKLDNSRGFKPSVILASKCKLLLPVFVYAAIFAGLYVFKSAWTAILAYHILIVLVLVLDPPAGLWKKLTSGWNHKQGILLTLFCTLAGLVLFLFLPIMQPDGCPLSTSLDALGLTGDTWILFMLYFSIVHPILEEIFWRDYLVNTNSRYPITLDFAFAGYHILVLVWFVTIPWVALAFVVLCAASWIWRITADRNNGLLIPIVSHAIADLSVIIAVSLIK